MSNIILPDELLVEIFSRVPTKTVGRYKCLTKYWSDHLSQANFVKKHLIARKLAKTNRENLALVAKDEHDVYISEDNTSISFGERLLDNWKTDYVLGSCNGMILLSGSEELLLVNPITLQYESIPHVNFEESSYGLGYDSNADEYKVVALTTGSLLSHDQEQDTTSVDVYSLKTLAWKRVQYLYGKLLATQCEGGAFLNGALHWFVRSKEESGMGFQCFIVAFDLGSEVFRKISCSADIGLQNSDCDLFVVGGCLALLGNSDDSTSKVWILRDYEVEISWVPYSIEGYDGRKSDEVVNGERDSIFALLCYNADGELLFLTGFGYLFACNLEQGTVRRVIPGGFDSLFDRGTAFVDSLVSPK